MAELKEPEGFFERAYRVNEGQYIGKILLKNTPKSKRRFLKKASGDIIFKDSFVRDEIIGQRLRNVRGDVKGLLAPHLEKMIAETVSFAGLRIPLDEAAVFAKDEWKKYARLVSPLARLVSIVGAEGSDTYIDGAPVRFEPRMKRLPSLAVMVDDTARLAPILRVPTVDIRNEPDRGRLILSKEAVAFKVPEELKELGCSSLNADSAAYFIEKGFNFTPQLMSLRKKSCSFFTFS